MVSERIRQLRSENGMNQVQLAEAIGMRGRESALRMWELGKSNPPITSLIDLADFFGVSVDYLIGRSSERGPVKNSFDDVKRIGPKNRGRYDEIITELKIRLWTADENDENTIMQQYELFGDLIDAVFKHGMAPSFFGSDDISLLIGSIDEKWLTPIRSRLIQVIADKYICAMISGGNLNGQH